MPVRHLGIILDGNRRWAKERGLPSLEGHRRGYENVKMIVRAALARGIEFLSVFVFSTENWNRSKEEVTYLMDLLHFALSREIDFYMKEDARLKVIGSREKLSEKILSAIDEAERKTAGNARGQINLCLNYGGRAEIVEAAKRLAAEGLAPEEITEKSFASKLWTAGISDPDLVIRTSGEQRLSGFLTWESVYSELLFVDTYWPAFGEKDLDEALAEFERRERRFGK